MNDALADFSRWLRGLAHRYGLPAFWRWWLGELLPLVPAVPRAAIKRWRLRPMLAFGTDAAMLWEPRIVNGTLGFGESLRIPLGGDPAATLQAGRTAIDSLPRRAYGGTVAAVKVVIALPPGQVLRKRLSLPAAVEQDLRQALTYDLDRHTPFKPDELYFDAAVVSRDLQRKEIGVDWAAALKSAVDNARRQAESWGAVVVAVTPDAPGSAGPAMTAASKLNLLPQAAGHDDAKARLRDLALADHRAGADAGRCGERAAAKARDDGR
jgi:general secretion pathway protein L